MRLFEASVFVIVLTTLAPVGDKKLDQVMPVPKPYDSSISLCQQFAGETERDMNGTGPKTVTLECKEVKR